MFGVDVGGQTVLPVCGMCVWPVSVVNAGQAYEMDMTVSHSLPAVMRNVIPVMFWSSVF